MAFTLSRPRSHPLWLILGALALLMPIGCKEQEEIRSYDAPRPDAQVERPKNRILAALFFRLEDLWTFKLVGPEAKIQEMDDDFKKFLNSVRFLADGNPNLSAAPLHWIREKNVEGRFAGFTIGPKDDGVELTVVKVDRGKDQNTVLFANVNRWRRQLDLSRIGFDDLENFVKPFETKEGEKFFLVDLKGPGSGKTAPGGMMAAPGVKKAPNELLRQSEQVTFDKPEGWREVKDAGGRNAFDIKRAATLEVGEGENKAVVTIIPMGKAAGSLLDNVNRWGSKELGLPEIAEKDLERLVKGEVDVVSSSRAFYVDLTGTAGGAPKRTLAVMVPHKDRTWFIKMMGPPDLVGKQKTAFESFARSVKFPGGR